MGHPNPPAQPDTAATVAAEQVPGSGPHTAFRYGYADAANYKLHGGHVFPGIITPAELATVRGALQDGELFLPDQVGLTDLLAAQNEWAPDDDDHVWHTVEEIELTDAAPTCTETIHEFVNRFVGITWDVVAAADRYGRY